MQIRWRSHQVRYNMRLLLDCVLSKKWLYDDNGDRKYWLFCPKKQRSQDVSSMTWNNHTQIPNFWNDKASERCVFEWLRLWYLLHREYPKPSVFCRARLILTQIHLQRRHIDEQFQHDLCSKASSSVCVSVHYIWQNVWYIRTRKHKYACCCNSIPHSYSHISGSGGSKKRSRREGTMQNSVRVTLKRTDAALLTLVLLTNLP